MKIVLSFICFILISFPPQGSIKVAYAEDTSDSQNIDETISEILDENDFHDYNDFLKELELLNEDISIEKLIQSVLNNEFDFDFKYLLTYILNCFLGNIKVLLADSVMILIIIVLMSILNNLVSNFAKGSTKKIVHIACYGAIIAIVGAMLGSCISSSTQLINDIEKFTSIVFPVLLTLVTAIGSSLSVAIYQPLIIVFAELIIKIVNYIVMPAFFVSFVFSIVGNLSDDLKLDKIASFSRTAGGWVIGVTFGLFVTYATAQGITGSGIDSIAAKGVKYALGNYVPIIGNYLKDGFDLVTAGCIIIKNALGFVSVVILLMFAATPIIKTLSTMLVIKLTAAISEPFGNKKISDMLNGVSKSLILPIIACLAAVFSVLLMIMLIILTCNRGVI